MIADIPAFIRANTAILTPPLTPELRLHLADDATALWRLTEEELGEIGLPPPYWAFAWAGGQALARYVLDHPDIVRGKSVLDLGAGSGLDSIAAARAGAAHVRATDIDAFAIEAIRLNAGLNDVTIEGLAADLVGADVDEEIILVGDMFYERELAPRLHPWLIDLKRNGRTVLIGDPGRTYMPKSGLVKLAGYDVPVTRALEDSELKRAAVWALEDDFSPADGAG